MMMAGMDMFGGKALGIGDKLDRAAPHRPLCVSSTARWYALTVMPQREDQTESWLKKRGVYGFHPVIHCKSTVRGVVRDYDRRYLPGLVFARFKGEPVKHEVLACPWISGAICRADRQWGILNAASLRALHTMRRIDTAARVTAAAERARAKVDIMIAKGNGAMFRVGPFKGFECEIVELKADGGARVKLHLFGREVLLPATTDDLIPVKKDD